MSLAPGTRLGSYQVLSRLGAGGMGEVYRARDEKLKRDVAIKILPGEVARDPDRISRFQREAEVLASLNHTNIAAIYDFQEANGSSCLMLELGEGDTLADRLARGSLPLDETLHIAKQICEALAAAHERGIVHRDLKPANIKIRPDGQVKVLDFGLAKALAAEGADLSNSPTEMASAPGIILGTTAYMSPEQAKGKEAYRTSDVWAFGCVLYEMLTGRRPFDGESSAEILGRVLETDPDWTRLPIETPPDLRKLVQRCLRKDRNLRLQHIGDARIEIEETQSGAHVYGQAPQRSGRPWARPGWISALGLLALAAGVATWAFRPAPLALETRFEIPTPPTASPGSLAISPDGKTILFAVSEQGRSQFWIRSLDSVSSRPLEGTDGATYPFWSPDSQSVGFFTNTNLSRIDIEGGSVRVLAGAAMGSGGAWNRDGVILFSQAPNYRIHRISASGGKPVRLEALDSGQGFHTFPSFLPDGNHFLYYVVGQPEDTGVYVGDLEGSKPRRLIDSDAPAVYAPSGQLLFRRRQAALLAQNLDATRLQLTGNPTVVAPDVGLTPRELGGVPVSVSATGAIAYRAGSTRYQRRSLLWFDRSGKGVGRIGDIVTGESPSMSPDGRTVALFRRINGNVDIWLLEIQSGMLTRFTSDAADDTWPAWSPHGRRIVFASYRTGHWASYLKSADDPLGSDEALHDTTESEMTPDWSADGRLILYEKSGDIWAAHVEANRGPFQVVHTAEFIEQNPRFSPDGKWIAYVSDESSRHEIYVRPFPNSGGRFHAKISTNGGAQPCWRSDSGELFYIDLEDRLMAVPIQLSANAQTVKAGTPIPLFRTQVNGALQSNGSIQYVASPDGQRFLMNTVITEATTMPITLILNWKATLLGRY